MDFFAYGSLIFEEVMTAVTGRKYSGLDARLEGFARYRVKDESYPGIVASEHSFVDGFLYRRIDPTALSLLDRFEGEYYKRESVEVTTGNAKEPAQAYIFRPEFSQLLTREAWQKDVFKEHHLSGFLARYKGFTSRP
jgi:gamma-glutamylcyclotransferase (GGCT)/AIG2-like uncharacterized protein YtfP